MSTHRPQPKLPNWLVTNRNFVLLWFAYGVAAMGDHLSEMALLKERGGFDRADVTRVQALISFGFFLPFVLLGPVAGWWSDRFSRKYTMIAADVVRAVIVFNLVYIVRGLEHWLEPARFLDPNNILPPGGGWGDLSILLPLGFIGAIAAFFSPARQALLPTLVREDQLVRANAMINALGTIGTIVAAVLGGYLVSTIGPQANFHVNGGTFLASAVFVAFIAMSQTRAVESAPLEGVIAPVKAGFRYVWSHQTVRALILLATVFWACAGVVVAVTPAISNQLFPKDYTAAGSFRGVMVVGMVLGATVMTILGQSIPPQLAVLLSLAGASFWVAILCIAVWLHWGVVLTGACLVGIGGAGAALLVTIMASLQRFVPDQWRGRVSGVADMTTMGAMVIATGLLGIPNIPGLDRYVPLLLILTSALLLASCARAALRYLSDDEVGPVVGFIRLINRFFARFWLRLKREGHCTVPREGAVIIAANHTAGVDPMAIISECPHRLPSFIVAEEYYNVPVAHTLMKWGRCIPIDRKNPGKSFLTQTLRLLKDGGCLGIFPQGTFEEPGKEVPEAKSGVGVLALRTGATVIPCHISGTRYFDNPFLAFFVRHNVRIKFGPPVDLSAFAGREKDKAAPDEATALIWNAIEALAPAKVPDSAATSPANSGS